MQRTQGCQATRELQLQFTLNAKKIMVAVAGKWNLV